MEDRTKVEGIIKIVAFPYLGAEWLIKTIKDGNIDSIKNFLEKYGIDVKIII